MREGGIEQGRVGQARVVRVDERFKGLIRPEEAWVPGKGVGGNFF